MFAELLTPPADQIELDRTEMIGIAGCSLIPEDFFNSRILFCRLEKV